MSLNGCRWLATLVSAGIAFSVVGCAGNSNKPTASCLVLFASENLNLFEGEPHPVTVYVYPLSSPVGFSQASIEDLLEGESPKGAQGPHVPITVSPGEERLFEELFPPETNQLGVLADYYRAPGDPEGQRTQIVDAGCGWFNTGLVLSPRDIYRK